VALHKTFEVVNSKVVEDLGLVMLENIPPPSCAAFLALSPALGSIFLFSPVTGSFSEIPQLVTKRNIIISTF
jgi:hypothetical protein